MNLRLLNEAYHDYPERIDALAVEQGLDPVVARGTAMLLLANDGNLASLSPKQRHHFDLAIKPLLD